MAEGLLHHGHKEEKHDKTYSSEFMNWLEHNSSFFWTQFLAGLGFVAALLEIVVHFHEIFKDKKAPEISHDAMIGIFVIQCIFILIVIFFLNGKTFTEKIHIGRYKKYYKILLGKPLESNQEQAALKETELNLNIFARYWLLFWKWIFLLYMVLSLHDLFNIDSHNPAYFTFTSVIEPFLNNFSMLNLFLCFLVIQSPMSSLSQNRADFDKQFNRFLNNKSTLYTLVIGFGVLHFLILLAYFLKYKYQFPALTDEILIKNAFNINLFFKILSGVFNCFCLALLIARLDSKIINVPSSLISILIFYAAMQPLYVFFDNEQYYFIVLIVSAFTLAFKVYFYLIVAYIINTGRLTDLFFTFPLIKKLIEEEGYEKKHDPIVHNSDVNAFNRHLDQMLLVLRTSGYSSYKFGKKFRALSKTDFTEPETDSVYEERTGKND